MRTIISKITTMFTNLYNDTKAYAVDMLDLFCLENDLFALNTDENKEFGMYKTTVLNKKYHYIENVIPIGTWV